jgi:hypothetical protein
VIGIWRQVMVHQFPGMHPRAHLVMLLRGSRSDVGTREVGIALRDPNGHLQMNHRVMMHIAEPPAGVVGLEAPGLAVMDLPLPLPGRYSIVISIDGVESETVDFTAVQAPPPPQGNLH